MALIADAARTQSIITTLQYDDKGNIVGVIKKAINPKLKRKSVPKSRRHASNSSSKTSGVAPIDAGAKPREVLIFNPPVTLLPHHQADGYQLLEPIILNNIDAQFLHLRALPGIIADGSIDGIFRRVPGILTDANSFFNVSAGKPGGRVGAYANDITKCGCAPSRCGRGLSIGIIDTAFSPNHPPLFEAGTSFTVHS